MSRPLAQLTIALFLLLAPIVPAMAADEVTSRYADDARTLEIARHGLQAAVDFARSRPELFGPAQENAPRLLDRSDKLAIWNAWSIMLDSQAALDQLRRSYGGFDLLQKQEQRSAAFALNHAAFLAGYRHALEFIALADANPALDTILNEPVPELGLAANTFSGYKFRFLNVAVASEFAALAVIEKSYADSDPKLRIAMDADCAVIWAMVKGKGHVLTLKNSLAVVRQAGFVAWFPVQKGVSEWMGDTKVHRRGRHLISADQIESMKSRLQPGDILVERHEWYLSNLGLPGFWTHEALYIGTPEERRAFFDDPEVRRWVQSQGIASGELEALLQARDPAAYRLAATVQPSGAPRILEAISEGVSFTSLEYSGASDSLAALRPRLSKREKAQALLRAFHYSGRPYDFNFDFQTDASLVCSELVFKAYAPGEGVTGMNFPMAEVLGRPVSTPNSLVRQFDQEAGSATPQTDFVLFLDGFESEQRAVESTPEQFRTSWQRPNWHILIQDAPPATAAAL